MFDKLAYDRDESVKLFFFGNFYSLFIFFPGGRLLHPRAYTTQAV
jgi:hypothetical protein